MGVDKYWRLYINEEWCNGRTVEELAGILEHEINHLLRDHPMRHEIKQPESHLIWNIAADCEINDDLLASGTILPEGGQTPQLYKLPENEFAEWYYEKLLSKAQKIPSSFWGKEGEHGSNGGGPGGAWEHDAPDKSGQVGVDRGRHKIIQSQVAKDMQHAKEQGKLYGEWEDWINSVLTPKAPWRKLLSRAVQRAFHIVSGKMDYSYRKPSRRQSIMGNILTPSLVGYQSIPAVVLDTSGSMGKEELEQCAGEIDGILANTSGYAWGIQVDAEVHEAKRIRKVSEMLEIKGRGGTNMGIGIEYAVTKIRPRPAICIVLTDGLTDWPQEAPPLPTIVCLVGPGCAGEGSVPDWATTITVNNEGGFERSDA
jgi:predicted metal-dependent peptidase